MRNITEDQLKKIESMATDNMSRHKDRKVEIYRSSDPWSTGAYFLSEGRDVEAEFELVAFDFSFEGESQFFLRYPQSECYIELYSCGSASSHGTMEEKNFRNLIDEQMNPFVYEEKQRSSKVKILKHKDTAVIILGYSSGFNFLKRVAAKGYTRHHDEDPMDFGGLLIDDMLKRKCVPIASKRKIESAFYTKEVKLVVLDAPAYKYSYEALKCYYGTLEDGMTQGEISNFQRYRDGGTTMFNLTIGDKVHKYFNPTQFGHTGFDGKKLPEWNNELMIRIPKEEYADLAIKIGIDLAPEIVD